MNSCVITFNEGIEVIDQPNRHFFRNEKVTFKCHIDSVKNRQDFLSFGLTVHHQQGQPFEVGCTLTVGPRGGTLVAVNATEFGPIQRQCEELYRSLQRDNTAVLLITRRITQPGTYRCVAWTKTSLIPYGQNFVINELQSK